MDEGKIGGRCETSFSLNVDGRGKRLACFMLDGKCAWSSDSGKNGSRSPMWAATGTMRPWIGPRKPQTIFAALHESGGQVMLSRDGGQTWTKQFKEAEFDKSGGLGVFNRQTLVYTQKGKGIQRSTDCGETWTKVASEEPLGRLVTIHRGQVLAGQGRLARQHR